MLDALLDAEATNFYAQALAQIVTSETRLLELGAHAGPLALHARKLGAQTATVLQASGWLKPLRQMALDNGIESNFHCLAGSVELLDPGPKFNLILCRQLPCGGAVLADVLSARDRLMMSEGRLLPQSQRWWMAPANAPCLHQSISLNPNRLGLELQAVTRYRYNRVIEVGVNDFQLPWAARVWQELDLALLGSPGFRKQSTWDCDASTEIHGLVAYSEDDLGHHWMRGEMTYFFPASRPLRIEKGEKLDCFLHTSEAGEGLVWSWGASVQGGGSFRQSSLFQDPLNLTRMFKAYA